MIGLPGILHSQNQEIMNSFSGYYQNQIKSFVQIPEIYPHKAAFKLQPPAQW